MKPGHVPRSLFVSVKILRISEDKKTHKKNGLQVHTAASFLRKVQNSSCKKNQSGFWK